MAGQRDAWLTFWEMFEARVHKRTNLAGVQKFSFILEEVYLLDCLEDKATQLVEELGLFSALFFKESNSEAVNRSNIIVNLPRRFLFS